MFIILFLLVFSYFVSSSLVSIPQDAYILERFSFFLCSLGEVRLLIFTGVPTSSEAAKAEVAAEPPFLLNIT